MKPAVFRPAAAADVEDACLWYESQRPGLGDEFLWAVNDAVLEELHSLIQIAMGWYDEHLFSFYLKSPGTKSRQFRKWMELKPESSVPLERLLGKRSDELVYEYDFGDSWVHRIKLEKRISSTKATGAPKCTAGEGACPPEDCGGIGGYEYLLEACADETHPDHDEMIEWLGEDYDPARFDCHEVNHRLEAFWGTDA